ncbi:S9 family peptidase [Alteromonas sp. ASW11-19]|uniref:S9 family peptidase n=1 Tax=Alteromonas salexigens TaxID=2982530 RepID=A0ABT2VIL7_9ALTE|nr:S9 family peptidase [Alteromonas salexigens]MCU7552980.1 S9 family peptidase [Alteromonas salexigens]
MKQLFYLFLLTVFTAMLTGCASDNNRLTSTNDITPPPLIERDVLFGNPTRYQGRLSPDGTKMSFRAPVNGVMEIWVGDRDNFNSAEPVTHDGNRGVPSHFWALDSEHVLYMQDQDGDENWHLYSVHLNSGKITDLTPYAGVQAQLISQSRTVPGVVLVGMNDRDARWHDAYRVDLATGKRTLEAENPGVAEFYADHNLNVRLAMRALDNGSTEILSQHNGQWKTWLSIPQPDVLTTKILGFDADNTGVYMLDSRNRDTAALVHLPLGQDTPTVIAQSDKVDVTGVLMHPQTHAPVAYVLDYIQPVFHPVERRYAAMIQQLNEKVSGGTEVLAQTLDNRYWTVYVDESDRSPVYKIYDTQTGTLDQLFVTQPQLDNHQLAQMQGVVIPARDGLELVSYLTLPLTADPDQDGKAEHPAPLVMLVHGGPWGRDSFGYDAIAQWLSNRGYAVLQVNFRSSTGFGKAFLNAGNHEWARAIHNDILDAKDWAIAKGITRADEVAIMGGSFGGYATLVGMTFTPTTFSCGVDIVGPSNLVTLLESIPPYWESFRTVFHNAIGDPNTEEGLAMLKERSPLTHVDNIQRPLLIAQGANDPRVKQAESDQIVTAMKERDIPVTYVLYPDEGHGFQKPENRLSFFAVAESFLGECLGGRVQPIGDDFDDASIQIVHGGEYLPEVKQSLQASVQ